MLDVGEVQKPEPLVLESLHPGLTLRRPELSCTSLQPLSPVEAGVCVLQEDSRVPAALENTIPAELVVGEQGASEVLKRQEAFSMRRRRSAASTALPPEAASTDLNDEGCEPHLLCCLLGVLQLFGGWNRQR